MTAGTTIGAGFQGHHEDWYEHQVTGDLAQMEGELRVPPIELMERYEILRFHVGYGIVDKWLLDLDRAQKEATELSEPVEGIIRIKDNIERMKVDFNTVQQILIHNHQVMANRGMMTTNHEDPAQATVVQTPMGVMYQQQNQQWAYQHAPMAYGQQGYAPQQHPSVGAVGWGLISRAAGIPPVQQQQQYPPPPGYY